MVVTTTMMEPSVLKCNKCEREMLTRCALYNSVQRVGVIKPPLMFCKYIWFICNKPLIKIIDLPTVHMKYERLVIPTKQYTGLCSKIKGRVPFWFPVEKLTSNSKWCRISKLKLIDQNVTYHG